VTEPRQSNRYAFAGQDPVNMVDPSGAHFTPPITGCFFDCDYQQAGSVGVGGLEVAAGGVAVGVGVAVSAVCAIGSDDPLEAIGCAKAGAAVTVGGGILIADGLDRLE